MIYKVVGRGVVRETHAMHPNFWVEIGQNVIYNGANLTFVGKSNKSNLWKIDIPS